MTPQAPMLGVEWSDPETGRKGYLVIDRLVRGVASGGLRMREGCTLEEVRGLARGMSLKEALHYDPNASYVPLGGAKGGIDCDPRSAESDDLLVRYLQAMRPYIEQFWTTGEDLGLTQSRIDDACARAGLASSVQAIYPLLDDAETSQLWLQNAFAVSYDGVPLHELAGGCGVAESALAALEWHGWPAQGKRVAVQGFGTMGSATALFLERAGLSIVAVADQYGTVVDESGLDVQSLFAARDAYGALDRSRLPHGATVEGPNAWVSMDVDVLVPAAVSYAIGEHNQHLVRAGMIVEAANMPVLPSAEAGLARRGVVVLPDVVVNSGTNAWWWWTLFGDVRPEPAPAFEKIRGSMRELVEEVLGLAERDGVLPRVAASRISGERTKSIRERYGTHR